MTSRNDGGALGHEIVARMEELTWERHGELALGNARRNAAYLDRGQSIAKLRGVQIGEDDSAIIVAAGPSIRRHDPIRLIKDKGYKGAVIATDSAIAYCLRNGVVPDVVVTLDPHATRIVRWFGDPRLTEESIRADDYYRRQDMDTVFADELRANREILSMLDRHGKDIRICLSTSASEAVVNRVLETGMQVYWWNPMLDDPDLPDSKTRELYRLNRLPCINAGGNVGAACWQMADAVLGKRKVALTGMDFSYYGDTDYSSTQYYREALALVGKERLKEIFIHIDNPHIGQHFYTDPAYYWYRQAFLDMVQEAQCQTFNCTQGGILFGEGIEFIPLKEFLDKHTCG